MKDSDSSVIRLRYAAKLNPGIGENLAPYDKVSFLPMEAIGVDGVLDLNQIRNFSDVSKGYTGFINGDVLIAKITPCFENGKGAIAKDLINGVGFGTTELHVLRVVSRNR